MALFYWITFMLESLASPGEVKPTKEKDERLYIVIPYRAFKDKRLTPRLKDALLCVCSYADKQGNLWPGVKTLAKDMGINHPTMVHHIQKLTDYGYLKVIKEGYKPGEQAKRRAVIFDPENPINEETWLAQQSEKERETEQNDSQRLSTLPDSTTKQDLQAVFKVWKACVLERFPGTPITYDEKALKSIARYPLENVKKIAPRALQACRVPPGSVRLLLRYLKK